MVAHIVVKHSLFLTRHVFTRPLLAAAGWLTMFGIMFAIIYGLFGVHSGVYVNPRILDAFFNAFARTAWGIALGWLVLATAVNRSGPIGRILNWSGWSLPAKLSYAAYLIHPLILLYFVQTQQRPFHYGDLTTTIFYLGCLLFTFLVSVPFSLLFESPVMAFQKLFI